MTKNNNLNSYKKYQKPEFYEYYDLYVRNGINIEDDRNCPKKTFGFKRIHPAVVFFATGRLW